LIYTPAKTQFRDRRFDLSNDVYPRGVRYTFDWEFSTRFMGIDLNRLLLPSGHAADEQRYPAIG